MAGIQQMGLGSGLRQQRKAGPGPAGREGELDTGQQQASATGNYYAFKALKLMESLLTF